MNIYWITTTAFIVVLIYLFYKKMIVKNPCLPPTQDYDSSYMAMFLRCWRVNENTHDFVVNELHRFYKQFKPHPNVQGDVRFLLGLIEERLG